VSLVAPEDAYHHNQICESLTTAGVKEMVRVRVGVRVKVMFLVVV
jgi:hypothetical protein